jgi:DNA-binding NarL/FixJ family response regulator
MDSLLPADAENSVADLIPGESLSTRELEVLAALAEGMGNKDIAARLRISEHTVKFHVRSIMGKFGAATRGEAVARGVREGLVVL